jgi:flagellar hook-associated protein 1 FlgK
MAPQLADLNKQITSVQALGFPANDLLDKRDYLLDQLAKLTDYVLATDENGAISVSIGSTLLVFGNQYRQLADASDISSGEIGGLKDAEASVQQVLADVNTLAGQIITSVNALHQTGYDLDGNAGGLFFNGSDAATIGLDPAISSDLRKIAASSQAGVVGDGSIAREIGNLKRQLTMNGGTVSFDDFYNGLVTNLGVAAKNAENSFEVENLVLEQIENQRSSVSGVSLDDEMVNLTQYQRSYEAAARFVTVADSLLDTLINRTGVI